MDRLTQPPTSAFQNSRLRGSSEHRLWPCSPIRKSIHRRIPSRSTRLTPIEQPSISTPEVSSSGVLRRSTASQQKFFSKQILPIIQEIQWSTANSFARMGLGVVHEFGMEILHRIRIQQPRSRETLRMAMEYMSLGQLAAPGNTFG